MIRTIAGVLVCLGLVGVAQALTVTTDPSNHPRLYFSRDEIPKLKEKVEHGIPKWCCELLIQRCESLRTSINLNDSRWARVKDQPSNWNNSRDILDLSLGYVITGNTAYRDLAIAALMKVCSWPTWYVAYEPNRGLLVQSAAMAYDWLYEELGRDRAQKVAEKIAFECEQMSKFLAGADGKAATRRISSMAPRTYGPFGVAAIALKDEYVKADEWIRLARESLGTWVGHAFDDDGAFYYSSESDYNALALNGVLGFYVAYRRLTGVNLCDTPRLRKNVLYQLYKLEPQRDGQGQFGVYVRGGGGAPQNMVGLAAELNDGLARWYYEYVYGPNGLKLKGWVYTLWCPQNGVAPLLWWKDVPIEYPDSSARLGGAMHFRGSGKVVLRTGFESVEDFHFALECPPARTGHTQAEVGNYILNAYGERFIEDPGTYGGMAWAQTPEAHNLVLIDNVGPAVRGQGTIDAFIHTDFADYLLANQKKAYDARSPVERAHRHVLFVRPSYFVVVDDVKKDAALHRYELLLHTDRERETATSRTPGQFIMRGAKADLLIRFASPLGVEMGRRHVTGVPTILSFAAPQKQEQGLFFTLLHPVRQGATAPRPTVTDSDDLLGIAVNDQDIVGYNRGGQSVTYGECTTDAKVFHARALKGVSAHYLAANATGFRQLGVGFRATVRITAAFKGTRGKVITPKATSLTLRYPAIKAIEVDGKPTAMKKVGMDEASIDLGPGEYEVRIIVSGVRDRHVFYNHCSFDGNKAAADADDDSAIAADKTPLLPGQTATFANYTSYSRGINGIMVDIAGLPGTPTTADFTFKVGNDNNPAAWANAPALSGVTVRNDAGVNGSDRITIIWPDNTIQKQWLQVTVKATAATGLATPDVFYFGNAIGEMGNSTADAKVTLTDQVGVRNNPHTLAENPADIDDAYDFNRDGKVGPTDEISARNNSTVASTALQLIAVP